MSGAKCPNREELVTFHLGTLPEAAAETVINHLAECASCQAMLETFDEAVDTLVARLRHPASEDERLHEPQCRAAVARAEAIVRGSPAAAFASGGTVTESATLGELGEYQLLEKLGQGGMGAVYKARHTKLNRIVALKVLPQDRTKDESAIARFEREMEAVGAVDHPNIVRATDARDIEGTRFLVMEYVEGEDLSKLVRRLGPLRIADACELVRQAAVGLQYAHEHGLVHRDIKPSNLMLTPSGQVKILDLGLALLEGPHAQEFAELTDAGQIMGTLDYMAPEQGSDSHDVDIRADVWSLGATLYKLLCGEAPFSGEQYNTPVKKIKALATEAVPPISERDAEVPDELAAILNRMLAREPADRFATPADVEAALAPFTTGCNLPELLVEATEIPEPPARTGRSATTGQLHTSALEGTASSHESGRALDSAGCQADMAAPVPRPDDVSPNEAERSKHSALQPAPHPARRRWRPWAVAVGLMLLFVGAGLALEVIIRINRGGREKIVRVRDGSEVTIGRRGKVEVKSPEDEEPTIAPAREIDVGSPGPKTPPGETAQPLAIGLPVSVKPIPINIQPEPQDLNNRLNFTPQGALSRAALVTKPYPIEGVRSWTLETIGHRGDIRSLAYDPDGDLLVTGGSDGGIRLWNARTGNFVRVLHHGDERVESVAWSPDKGYLASTSPWPEGCTRLWEVESGLLVRRLGAKGSAVAWSPDGRILATGAMGQGRPIVWDIPSGMEPREIRFGMGHDTQLAWSPDARILAAAGYSKTLALLDAGTWECRHKIINAHDVPIRALAWSPDGATVASAAAAPERIMAVRLWDAQTGKLRGTLAPRPHGTLSLAWSRNGENLALGGTESDNEFQLWNAEHNELVYGRDLSGKEWATTKCLAYAPDGKTIAAGDSIGTVHVLEAESGDVSHTLPGHTGPIWPVAFAPNGERLACANADGTLRLWETNSGRLLSEIVVNQRIQAMAWSPDNQALATAGLDDEKVRVWNTDSGECIREIQTEMEVKLVAWSPDGRFIATGGDRVKVWDAVSGQWVQTFLWPGDALAWSPDSKTLAIAVDKDLKLCNPESGEFRQVPTDTPESLLFAVWSPDGKAIATTDRGPIYIWDTVREDLSVIEGTSGHIGALAWLDGGKTIAAGVHFRGEIRFYDVKSKKLFRRFSHSGHAFSPDGRMAADVRSKIRLWRTEDGALLRTMLSLRDGKYAVISPEGHWRGSPGVEQELVYVVQTYKGQETLAPEEFSKRYGWRNDPEEVSWNVEGGEPKAEEEREGSHIPR